MEINSSFYRPHKPQTYRRWAESVPGGWSGLIYRRLHGSPDMYRSDYPADRLEAYAAALAAEGQTAEAWCVFDNTALGHAIPDALDLASRLAAQPVAAR